MATLLHFSVDDLPRSIVWDQPLSDDLLERLCVANQLLQLERTKEGVLRVNPPTGLLTSDGNSEIIQQLRTWWKTHRQGRVTDSNAGFYLRDGSMLSPDAAYISPSRLNVRSAQTDKGFPHLCPDFVIELLSESNSLSATKRKMDDWIANGVLLGWLIDTYQRTVFVYAPDVPPGVFTGHVIAGTGPVEGLHFDLSELWACYEQVSTSKRQPQA